MQLARGADDNNEITTGRSEAIASGLCSEKTNTGSLLNKSRFVVARRCAFITEASFFLIDIRFILFGAWRVAEDGVQRR